MRTGLKAAVAATTFMTAGAFSVALAPPALAVPFTCGFSGSTVTVTISDSAPNSTYVLARTAAGGIIFNTSDVADEACSTATVTNTNAIVVNQTGGFLLQQSELPTLRLDLRDGGFAPGLSAEATGTPEIEVTVGTARMLVSVKATAAAETLSITGNGGTGLNTGGRLVNVNNDDDGDITVNGSTVLEVRGEGGNDVLQTSTQPGLRTSPTVLVPGPGTNTISSGVAFDAVDFSGYGGTGGVIASMTSAASATENDTMTGVENLFGTPDQDVLTGDAENNTIEGGGSTGAPDAVDGAGGFDILGFTRVASGVTVSLATQTASANVNATFTNMEGLLGSLYDDILTGGDGNDYLDGYASTTRSTRDTLAGGLGNDTMLQLGGRATVSYAAAPAAVVVQLDREFQGSAGFSSGGDGDDALIGNIDILGSSFNDTLTGSEEPERLDGGPGDDTLDPGEDSSGTLAGGGGVDRVSLATSTDNATIAFTSPTSGTVETDGLSGPSSFTEIQNVLGGPGNDVVSGLTTGAHDIRGGAGVDVVTYAGTTAPVTVSLDDLTDDGLDELSNFHADVEGVIGGSGNDFLSGSSAANRFEGGPGNDQLFGRGGNDTLNGDAGNDRLFGQTSDDVLSGGADVDLVSGGDGSDRVLGGIGNDVVTGGNGDDDVFGEDGNDSVTEPESAPNGADLLSGGAGTDTVSYAGRSVAVRVTLDNRANDGSADEFDRLLSDVENVTGGSGADTLTGSAGVNTLNGGPGNDVLDGLTGADQLFGAAGVDTVDYRLRVSAVTADIDNVGDDGVAGEGDNVRSDVENLFGGSGNDRLTGSAVANRLAGGTGNDILTGGPAADVLDGGVGNDLLYARDKVRDSVVGGTGTDRAQVDPIDARSGVEGLL